MNKTLSIMISALVLAGCSSAGEGPMEPGIYAATQPDGTVTRMVVNNDGTYADMADNIPQPVDTGSWWRADGKLCLRSDVGPQEFCFTEMAGDEPGTFSLSNDEGMTSEFRSLV